MIVQPGRTRFVVFRNGTRVSKGTWLDCWFVQREVKVKRLDCPR